MLLCGLHCFANYQERINGCYIAAAVNIANAEIKAAGNGRCNNPKGHAKHGEGVGRSYNTVAVNITAGVCGWAERFLLFYIRRSSRGSGTPRRMYTSRRSSGASISQ